MRKVWWIIIGAVVLALIAWLLTKTAQAKTQTETTEAETAMAGVDVVHRMPVPV